MAATAMAMSTTDRMREPFRPSGRGHELLQTWAKWSRGGQYIGSGGEWSVKERLDQTHGDEPPDSVGAVDRILCELFRRYPDYRPIINRYYLDAPKWSTWEIAEVLGLTEGFVRMSILGVCDLVERRYDLECEGKNR